MDILDEAFSTLKESEGWLNKASILGIGEESLGAWRGSNFNAGQGHYQLVSVSTYAARTVQCRLLLLICSGAEPFRQLA